MRPTAHFFPGKKTRLRGENWEKSEKQAFIKIIRPSAHIIENKFLDTHTNKLRHQEWIKIQNQLKLKTGRHREIGQLKNYWGRIKGLAKKSVVEYRKALEDGHMPPSPPSADYEIFEMCSNDLPTDHTASECGVETKHTGHNHQVLIIENNVDHTNPIHHVKQESPLEDSVSEEHFSNEDVQSDENPLEESVAEEHFSNGDVQSDESEKLDCKTNSYGSDETNSKQLSHIAKKIQTKQRKRKTTRTEVRNHASASWMEQEYKLKIEYQQREAEHQQLRHRLEIDILKLEKEKKLLELGIIRNKLQLINHD